MINPSLKFNKAFKDQVEKCINTKFGKLEQYFIKATLSKKSTSVLALIIHHEITEDKT